MVVSTVVQIILYIIKMNNNLIDIVIVQMKIGLDHQKNLQHLIKKLNTVKTKRATVVVLHELSYLNYFPITKTRSSHLAISVNSQIIDKFKTVCKSKGFYLLLPFYEKSQLKYYNTVIMISPNGSIIGKYRKINLPNEHCYREKFHFDQSETGVKIFKINGYNIGAMICWDQWHSRNYNKLSEKNVDLILCPTSIGYASHNDYAFTLENEKKKWINVITSNSLMINTPIVIANRIGVEKENKTKIRFWGSSFITNADGDIVHALKNTEIVSSFTLNLDERKQAIKRWNFAKK